MSEARATPGPRVLIRADASPRIGGGHVMRCLSLADELARRGATVTFACASIPDFLAERVETAGHGLARIEPVDELRVETEQWDSAVLSPEAQREDAARAVAAAGGADWVVADHYRLDGNWLEAAAPRARRLVLDDLANRPQPCDILVDQTFGRAASDYAPWVPDGCRVLAGARYPLLRPEFAEGRSAALRRRREARSAGRLLVSLGTTDIGGVTLRALESLLAAGVDCPIDVVLGSGAQSLGAVRDLARADPRILLHVDRSDMAGLMAEADLAVGAPGTSSWERCCLGLPAVTVRLADNQALVSRMLADAGAAEAVDSPEAVGAAVRRLIDDGAALARMSAAAAAITDGMGARRVVDAMLGTARGGAGSLTLRQGRAGDSERLWLWRNDPVVREASKSSEAIAWADHERWFGSMIDDPSRRLFIAELDGEAAAMVRFDGEGDGALVSINVDPAARARGVGKAALIAACERYLEEAPERLLLAEIKRTNSASERIFLAAGFEAEPGEAKEFRRFRRSARPRED